MVNVKIVTDCGNAPRREIVRDLVIALADNDASAVAPMISTSAQWTVFGDQTYDGSAAILSWVEHAQTVTELEFASVLTHGKGASVDGTAVRSDGTTVRFSHVLEFAGHAKTAPLATVRSYLLVDERGEAKK